MTSAYGLSNKNIVFPLCNPALMYRMYKCRERMDAQERPSAVSRFYENGQ